MWSFHKGLLSLSLLHFCTSAASAAASPGCGPTFGNTCDNQADAPQDETSLLQVHQSVSLANEREGERPDAEMLQDAAGQMKVLLAEGAQEKVLEEDVNPKKGGDTKKDNKKGSEGDDDDDDDDDAPKTTTTSYTALPMDKFGKAAEVTKIKLNSAGDIYLLLGAIKVDGGAFIFFCFVFMLLYGKYPEILAIRSCVGWSEKEKKPEADADTGEASAADTAKYNEWLSTEWTEKDIQAMPKWPDGFETPEDKDADPPKPILLSAEEVFKKKNNWPAPKSARFSADNIGWLTWWHASWGLDLQDDKIVQCIGLDSAMLLTFTEMAMRILTRVGTPMLLVGAPLYIFLGGGAAGKDLLSWQGVGNVWYEGNIGTKDKSKIDSVQWIWWWLALTTWWVVSYVQYEMFEYMKVFLRRRKLWLMQQAEPESKTLLVELLPLPPPPLDPSTAPKPAATEGSEQAVEASGQQYWDDAYLKKFYEKLFPGQIDSAYVVRKAGTLIGLVDNYADIACGLKEDHPTNDDLMALRTKIDAAQTDLKDRRDNRKDEYYSVSGFVTFKDRHQRDAALHQRISETDGEFVTINPPAPQDVIYEDLETDAQEQQKNDFLGTACVVGLFFAFMPLVLAISKVTSLSTIEKVGFFKSMLDASGMAHSLGGTLASLGLTIMMSFLPTFLMMCFGFYCNKANQWKQLTLQKMYFWFLVFFVLLVVCVGSDLEGFIDKVVKSPMIVFSLLANRMPLTTHFYMNYCVMQPLSHGMNLTRYITFIKYFIWKNSCGYGHPGGGRSEAARFKSEPEDQEYYGIGSRSARFAFMLLVGLVFGTICPLINIFCYWNFFCCRTVYGYLITCVESRKNDLGGDCFVQQIKHVSESMLIYICLMVGIIVHRSESVYPAGLAAVSFFAWFISYMKLRGKHWETLSLMDTMIPTETAVKPKPSQYKDYKQRLEEVYLVPYGKEKDDGKGNIVGEGEKTWCDHYRK